MGEFKRKYNPFKWFSGVIGTGEPIFYAALPG